MLKQLQKYSDLEKPILVSGCMAVVQRDEVVKINPNVYFLRPKEINKAHLILDRISEDLEIIESSKALTKLTESTSNKSIDSIVPISSGCLGECTYCITRLARGRLKSYPAEKILQDIVNAVHRGHYEVRLTAQDTACYGYDNISNGNLARLLTRISDLEVGQDFRIRVGMMNPDSVKPILTELIESYSHQQVFKFLHLPVQSGSDELLAAMGRKYSVSEFFGIINQFRQRYPKLTVSTDIIVGYPGETNEQFQLGLKLLEKLQPNIVNITRFSSRPGTPASKLKPTLSGSEIKYRSRKLTEARFNISKKLNEGELGGEYDVLVTEMVKKGTVLARNNNYLPIVVKKTLPLGSWHRIKIIDTTDSYVIGKIVK
jgi:MiaB-like tRNA modifying enzyme